MSTPVYRAMRNLVVSLIGSLAVVAFVLGGPTATAAEADLNGSACVVQWPGRIG
ncbi:hypothetical protein [Saccharothrix carnea]|uniref:hypothetical protein n=1 Tax=Saccharothrix carnea TaxID=1280637 RepID=UPI0015E79DFC|nr:hypothetical protein [Saccharothrix carnea]